VAAATAILVALTSARLPPSAFHESGIQAAAAASAAEASAAEVDLCKRAVFEAKV
jgi:hypothetical protein